MSRASVGWTALAAALALAFVAGCAAPAAQTAPSILLNGRDLPTPLPPRTRPVVASALLHEAVDQGWADMNNIDGDDAWAPRDALLTYHGVQETYDEFARPVAAFVFRYPTMVFVWDHRGPLDVNFRGHYEPHDQEFAFDAADGRLMSVTDLVNGHRDFRPPARRDPIVDTLAVVAMAWTVFEATGHREMPAGTYDGHALFYNFTPVPIDHPLPGECNPHWLTSRWDPPVPSEEVVPLVSDLYELTKREQARTVICVEPGQDIPLWAFTGTNSSNYRLQRLGPSFALPTFRGQALPRVHYAAEPWQEVRGSLQVPGPVLAPPTSDGGLWAGEITARVQTLYLNPSFIAYRSQANLTYTKAAILNTDLGTVPLLGLDPPVALPETPGLNVQEDLLFFIDGRKAHSHIVYTRPGGPEQPDQHFPEPAGSDYEDYLGVPANALPPLPPDGVLQGQLSRLLPVLDYLGFMFGATDDGKGELDLHGVWQVGQTCTADADGWVTVVDAQAGYVESIWRTAAAGPDCGPANPLLENGKLVASGSTRLGVTGTRRP